MGFRKTLSEIDYFFAHYMSRGVKWLVYVNAFVFFCQIIVLPLFQYEFLFARLFGVSFPYTILRWHVWSLVTYMFVHGGGMHFLFNMFILWMFGTQVERHWGTRKFLRYYFIVGIGAAIFHLVVSLALGRAALRPMVGASGALYGILLAFALYYPDTYILMNFVLPIKAKYYIIIVGLMAFLSSYGNARSDIAHLTHLGGLLIGYLYLKGPDIINRIRRNRTRHYRFRN